MPDPKANPDTVDPDRDAPSHRDPSRPPLVPPAEGDLEDTPRPGPAGRRTPYPADSPPIDDLPGSEPDYEPGRTLDSPTPSI